jgi:DNA-binding NarL/FixJ family response regulator
MNAAPVKVLIIGKRGWFMDSLRALLANTAQIKVTGLAGDGTELEEMVANAQPQLVLIDAGLTSESYQTVLDRLSTRWPQIRRLVLTDSRQQQEAARNAGADGVLMKGFIIPDLLQAIQTLLP